MRAHSSLRLGTLRGTTPELLASPWYCTWAVVGFGKRDSPTRRPLLPLNAGTAEPVRVSPPEAVAYQLELWRPCTPAMAAGLTDHVWSLKEVLLYRVPPWPQLQVG